LVALIAEHPALADLGPPSEPPTLRYARGLLDAGQALSRALCAYRGAVRAALGVTPPSDDDVF
jgi:hypothetical protein